MAKRLRIQLVRPYQDEAEFIAAEGWTVHKGSIVLVGAPEVAVGTDVRCDVALATGQLLIRAEGRVAAEVAPADGRPGGLKLRFQRVAPDTQAFIQRVLERTVLTPPLDSGPNASIAPLTEPEEAEPAPRKAPDSGLHERVVAPVEPPPNRAELLDRLRARQRRRVEEREERDEAHASTGDDAG